ncbi:MAG: ATP-binding cassette domain-containing protein [Rhodoferax sp.]|nr:ATP-binding cassette domain-containing protein [Rhodoferax sp.]
MSTPPLVVVEGLTKHYPVREGLLIPREVGRVRAVDGVSFQIAGGETLGLVGESGCGKSTVAKLLVRLVEPTAGSVRIDGVDLAALDPAALRRARRALQIVFQDPQASLNPRMRAEDIVVEPLVIQGAQRGPQLRRRAAELLEMVGLSAAQAGSYPHEFSGGQRQRLGIARAIAPNPRFIVCDEAVSALDVSVQAQIINLLQDLQRDLKLSYLFISHDLSVVKHISDRVAVMYLGKIVEIADKRSLYRAPVHPYTRALIASIPVAHPRLRKPSTRLAGDLPSALAPPAGCAFHTRCAHAGDTCRSQAPPLRPLGPQRLVACHFAERFASASDSSSF